MKKRVGLLATLALCVTVGGVYATWNYADTTGYVDRETVSIGLTPVGSVTGESLEITNNSLSYLIDDEDGNHVGDKVVASGEITVTYHAAANNYENVEIYCNVEVDGAYFATTLTLNELTKSVTLDGTAKDHTWTLSAADLEITLGSTMVSLPTKAEYDAFTIAGNQIRVEFTTKAKASTVTND